jgi:hypothetical protein
VNCRVGKATVKVENERSDRRNEVNETAVEKIWEARKDWRALLKSPINKDGVEAVRFI